MVLKKICLLCAICLVILLVSHTYAADLELKKKLNTNDIRGSIPTVIPGEIKILTQKVIPHINNTEMCTDADGKLIQCIHGGDEFRIIGTGFGTNPQSGGGQTDLQIGFSKYTKGVTPVIPPQSADFITSIYPKTRTDTKLTAVAPKNYSQWMYMWIYRKDTDSYSNPIQVFCYPS
jgi:hypothetical protein